LNDVVKSATITALIAPFSLNCCRLYNNLAQYRPFHNKWGRNVVQTATSTCKL